MLGNIGSPAFTEIHMLEALSQHIRNPWRSSAGKRSYGKTYRNRRRCLRNPAVHLCSLSIPSSGTRQMREGSWPCSNLSLHLTMLSLGQWNQNWIAKPLWKCWLPETPGCCFKPSGFGLFVKQFRHNYHYSVE